MVLTIYGSYAVALPVLVAARFQGLGVAVDESRKVVDSLGNLSMELETPKGTIFSLAASLRYVANLSASSDFGGSSAFARAQVDQWCDWAFNELLPRRLSSAIASKRALLQSMVNMGVRSSPLQRSLRARAVGLSKSLAKLDAHLVTRTFLVGRTVTAADVAVAACLSDALAFLVPSEDYAALPNLLRWFRTVRFQPQFMTVAGEPSLPVAREGGMIDLRPRPEDVALLAEASVARNLGFKKAASQRDKEKALKDGGEEEKKSAPAAATSGAANVAATAAQPAGNLTLMEKSHDERIALMTAKLTELGIEHKTIRHEEAFTIDALLSALEGNADASAACKNLFLKAKKPKEEGDSRMWLVVALHDTNTNMKKIQQVLGYGKITVRFGDAKTLAANLGTAKGSVSPFSIMFDTAQQVNVALDSRMLETPTLAFHPLSNAASTFITPADLVKFIESTGHTVNIVDFSA